MIYVCGPGHGGPGIVANAYLEGTYSEVYPDISAGRGGIAAAVQAVLLPGRHPQPRRARDAGLDPRGGRARLFALARVRRRVRQPRSDRRLRHRRRRGRDRRRWPRAGTRTSSSTPSTTAPCCPSCTSTATRSPTPRCSPASPTSELDSLLRGLRLQPLLRRGRRSGDRCTSGWRRRSTRCSTRSGASRTRRAERASAERPRWPMIVLRTPKGWTGPKVVDGKPIEGTWRAHQVPLAELANNPAHLAACSTNGCGATAPRSCSTSAGRLRAELAALAPEGERRMSANPHANGGAAAARPAPARLPRLRRRRLRPRRRHSPRPRACSGTFLRDVMRQNAEARNFRIFGPDETASNRWTPSSR